MASRSELVRFSEGKQRHRGGGGRGGGGDRGPVLWATKENCKPHYKLFLVMTRISVVYLRCSSLPSGGYRRWRETFSFGATRGSLNSVHTVGSIVLCALAFGRLLAALSLAVNHNLTRFKLGYCSEIFSIFSEAASCWMPAATALFLIFPGLLRCVVRFVFASSWVVSAFQLLWLKLQRLQQQLRLEYCKLFKHCHAGLVFHCCCSRFLHPLCIRLHQTEQ